jgi:methionyl-tRNA formyltransferase
VLRARDGGPHGHVRTSSSEHRVGALHVMEGGRVEVCTDRRSSVELVEVAPAGRRRMGAVEWARGARIEPGERLG